jgi:ribosome-binding ATPase YchF (GTP1/OBG family)
MTRSDAAALTGDDRSDLGILQHEKAHQNKPTRARGIEHDHLLQRKAPLKCSDRHWKVRCQSGIRTGLRCAALLATSLLTAKPLLVVANAGEDQAGDLADLEAAFADRYHPPKASAVALCGALEMELAQLPEAEATDLRASYGLSPESALDRVIRTSSQVAGLAHFFTVGDDEVRAWTIAANTPAVLAARTIHSDMERGFIRAEVIRWDVLLECGGLAVARQRGLHRTERRDYRIQDGDIMHVLFNVGRW